MKKIVLLALGTALCATCIQAAEGDAAPKKEGEPSGVRRAEQIKKFDTDGNGELSESERAAMRESMRKTREEQRLKKYDKNGDGKLDDAEKEAMREDLKKRAEERGKRSAVGAPPSAPPAPPTAPAPEKK